MRFTCGGTRGVKRGALLQEGGARLEGHVLSVDEDSTSEAAGHRLQGLLQQLTIFFAPHPPEPQGTLLDLLPTIRFHSPLWSEPCRHQRLTVAERNSKTNEDRLATGLRMPLIS